MQISVNFEKERERKSNILGGRGSVTLISLDIGLSIEEQWIRNNKKKYLLQQVRQL